MVKPADHPELLDFNVGDTFATPSLRQYDIFESKRFPLEKSNSRKYGSMLITQC